MPLHVSSTMCSSTGGGRPVHGTGVMIPDAV